MEMQRISDRLGMRIDENIRTAVVALRANGLSIQHLAP
jgi:hypothetical protein